MLRIEAALRGDGWADQTSLSRELRAWARLAEEINAYTGTINDYTNDLCSRDYLEVIRPARPSDCATRSIKSSPRSTARFDAPHSMTLKDA